MTKALIIGLDGATFTVLDPDMERGVMPFLRGFVERGVRATLRSVMPPLTPPAWTSLMTGKRPGNHGVFDFFQKESPESEYLRLADSQDIRSATIWSLASDHGLRVTALNFPVTFPAPAVNGSVVPGGWMPWRQLRLGCHPPGLFDRLKALPSFNAQELAMDAALEEKAVEGCAAEEYADWIALHTRREQRWSTVHKNPPHTLHACADPPAPFGPLVPLRPAARQANPSAFPPLAGSADDEQLTFALTPLLRSNSARSWRARSIRSFRYRTKPVLKSSWESCSSSTGVSPRPRSWATASALVGLTQSRRTSVARGSPSQGLNTRTVRPSCGLFDGVVLSLVPLVVRSRSPPRM